MAKEFRKDIDYMMSHKMGLDDTFRFHCKACGKCCKNREDVLLTPYDLFRIARYLGRTPSEIVDKYCDTYMGPDSHLPVVRIKPVPPDNSCPFLRWELSSQVQRKTEENFSRRFPGKALARSVI